MEDAYVLIAETKISNVEDRFPVLDAIATAQRELLIITEHVDGEALATLLVRYSQSILAL